MAAFDIDNVEKLTMDSLKDFQRATVERIDTLFRSDHRRVLVADEVGMGKTLVARGAIVKTARIRLEENDDIFKVVYICSNISIAYQNIKKLKVSDTATIDGLTDTRLSMQHLRITRQELDPKLRDGFIQLIPLTPDTSFRLKNGRGTVNERALMYAILRRMREFSHYKNELERFFVFSAEKAWNTWAKEYYEGQVLLCRNLTRGRYPADLIDKIRDYNRTEHTIDSLKEHLRLKKAGKAGTQSTQVLNKLRVMFARISAQMLQPDLVIMDEFQRFKFLISSDEESETGILAKQFLSGSDTRVLLLSATPYKLYSTLEEIDGAQGVDEHYKEFLQVMDFLFKGKTSEFRKVWSDYNVALHELRDGDLSVLRIKNEAENAMYEGVCRTERISVMESGDYTDDSSIKTPVNVRSGDIQSYLAMGTLLKNIQADFSLPLDYAKSCPFLMSFMKNYKVKEKVEKYFQAHPEEVEVASDKLLWVNPSLVNNYQMLPKTNARLEKLKEIAFENHAELFLWIPPSKPYYELQGPYRGSKYFSKILVFSSWEMVPRMIASMISYEAERLTVGEVCKQADSIEKRNTKYNAKRRYPYHRLQFARKGNDPQRMTLFCLLYPSRTLAGMYQPLLSLNQRQSLAEIERGIREQIRKKLKELRSFETAGSRGEDARWYYLAPMLMDGKSYVSAWINILKDSITGSDEGEDSISSDRGNVAFKAHIERLNELLRAGNALSLGKMPGDLVRTLTEMVLASPAVCIYRSNGQDAAFATELAKTFLNYFNTTESTAVIQLSSEKHHARKSDENAHWQDVLTYCKDGCFQAMLDEYLHLVTEAAGFSDTKDRAGQIQKTMLEDLRIHTASYDVDHYNEFKSRVCNEAKKDADAGKMRVHYAVGFINSGTEEQKTVLRKDSIRGAFNSPLKPFVLATTSIGQEGLDFHNYCRKVMHWNLPGNPIDLEQREGRVNRYKCHAIRQNAAEKYGNIAFHDDLWKEMFEAAEKEREPGQSELVPYWCFGKNQSVRIERIVPMYPVSKDEITYERLIKILSLYRLTLGQAKQEELLEYLFKEIKNPEGLKKLFINLSPFSKEGKKQEGTNNVTLFNDSGY